VDSAPVILVEWQDAVCGAGWETDSTPELHSCTTVGYLIAESDDALLIASTISMGSNNARIAIPKAWIQTRREIKIETKQRKKQRQDLSAVGEGSDHSEV
jgi:hypothetical protein